MNKYEFERGFNQACNRMLPKLQRIKGDISIREFADKNDKDAVIRCIEECIDDIVGMFPA